MAHQRTRKSGTRYKGTRTMGIWGYQSFQFLNGVLFMFSLCWFFREFFSAQESQELRTNQAKYFLLFDMESFSFPAITRHLWYQGTRTLEIYGIRTLGIQGTRALRHQPSRVPGTRYQVLGTRTPGTQGSGTLGIQSSTVLGHQASMVLRHYTEIHGRNNFAWACVRPQGTERKGWMKLCVLIKVVCTLIRLRIRPSNFLTLQEIKKGTGPD